MKNTLSYVRTLVAAFVLLLGCSAHAVLPDGGWYWNPAESGRGFNIEIQNNNLFMAAFVYDGSGKPIWMVSGGQMTSATAYSGDLYQTDNGQCVGCAYRPPAENRIGTASVVFTGPLTATITLNGVAISVQRQQFGLDFGSTTQPLLGEWAFVEGGTSYPIYFGERISLPVAKLVSGDMTVVGNRAGETGNSNMAVGGRNSNGTWSILLDSSTSYYTFYTFSFAGFDRIEGTSYTYLKTGTPSGGLPFVAQRIKSASAAAGRNAPGTGKAARVVDGSLAEAINAQKATATERDSDAATVEEASLLGEYLRSAN